jgi:hydrogenase maturation factor
MRVACAALHMNGLLWHAMLTHATSVHEGPESGGLKGVLFIRKFRYDETPLKNRVKTWNTTLAQHEMDTSDHTKLMQVEFSIWALFQKIETGKFVVVHGQVPALLNAIDRTTAKNTLACLKTAMDVVPSFLGIAEKEGNFNWRVHMSTTDRYNANIFV